MLEVVTRPPAEVKSSKKEETCHVRYLIGSQVSCRIPEGLVTILVIMMDHLHKMHGNANIQDISLLPSSDVPHGMYKTSRSVASPKTS